MLTLRLKYATKGTALQPCIAVDSFCVSFCTGEEMLKASEGIQYARGEDQSIDSLKAKFNDYCSVQDIPYEENPFFTCVERQGLFPESRCSNQLTRESVFPIAISEKSVSTIH